MTHYETGRLLIAKPDMVDPNFSRTVVHLLQHDEAGALGIILNRPLEITVAEHFEMLADKVAYASVFFEGGPVASGTVVAIGASGGGIAELADIDEILAGNVQPPDQLRLFAGYSGWSAGQLEAEILSGSWITADTYRDDLGRDDIFGANPSDLWRTVLRRQPRPISQMALYPDDVLMN